MSRRRTRAEAHHSLARILQTAYSDPDALLESLGRTVWTYQARSRSRAFALAGLFVAVQLILDEEVGWGTVLALGLFSAADFCGAKALEAGADTKILAALDRRWTR